MRKPAERIVKTFNEEPNEDDAPPQQSPRVVVKPMKDIVEASSLKYLEKKPYKQFSEIEGQLWKNNIMFEPR